MMGIVSGTVEERFTGFVAVTEPRLRQVLVAWYGVDVGSEATADAMAHAWEHWSELETMQNPVGYLFRVAQSKSRRYRHRPVVLPAVPSAELPDIDPRLPAALAQCSPQQRAALLLVHAHGWTYADAAGALEISISTLRNHLERGRQRLRAELGGDDA
jgi:RNA polymerase sigma-70 factor (ECF subfamily)